MYAWLEVSWAWNGETGTYRTSFGYPEFTKEKADECARTHNWYWWQEGNGSCDCNRSSLFGLAKKYPEKNRPDYDAWPCGSEIKITNIEYLGAHDNRIKE